MTTPPPPYPPPPAHWTTPGRAPKRPAIVWDTVLTIVLVALLGILTFFVSVFGVFLVMASDPCGVRDCNTELIGLGVLVAVTLPWVVLIAAVVISLIRLVKRRIAFWVPLAASPFVIASWFAGAAIAAAGVPTG